MLARGSLKISGTDTADFLQGLVTQDITKVTAEKPLLACLLTPQGRFLHDFYIFKKDDGFILTPELQRIDDLALRLKRFKLRRDVVIETLDTELSYSMNKKDKFLPEPRGLGYIALQDIASADLEFDINRIRKGFADGSRDMIVEKSLLLENNYDAAIDWNKGCYIGQELTARMKYRALIKKQLTALECSGSPAPFDAPLSQNGKAIGNLRSQHGGYCLALLDMKKMVQGETITDEDGQTYAPIS